MTAASCHSSGYDLGFECLGPGIAALSSIGGGAILFIVGAVLAGVGAAPRAYVDRSAPLAIRF